MFGSLKRTASMQWALRKDLIFFAGCFYLANNADHLVIRRTINAMNRLGLYHQGPSLTARIDNVKM